MVNLKNIRKKECFLQIKCFYSFSLAKKLHFRANSLPDSQTPAGIHIFLT